MTFAQNIIRFFNSLNVPDLSSDGVEVINTYASPEVKKIVNGFYSEFFGDNNKRIFMLGINPGRFGGGLTGISFTDPSALREFCGIENNLGTKKELSSKFIYEMIIAYGGAVKFYSQIFLSALFPFALTKNGKNFNYYDDKRIFEKLKPDIIESLNEQLKAGSKRDRVIILGKKNAYFFKTINDEYNFFKQIIVLDHPRFIMQYKLKSKSKYIADYIRAIG